MHNWFYLVILMCFCFVSLKVLGRFGTPEECGKMCLCLAADATFCTGQDIHLSGGSELGYGIKNPNVN